jgi:hypothetical protein
MLERGPDDIGGATAISRLEWTAEHDPVPVATGTDVDRDHRAPRGVHEPGHAPRDTQRPLTDGHGHRPGVHAGRADPIREDERGPALLHGGDHRARRPHRSAAEIDEPQRRGSDEPRFVTAPHGVGQRRRSSVLGRPVEDRQVRKQASGDRPRQPEDEQARVQAVVEREQDGAVPPPRCVVGHPLDLDRVEDVVETPGTHPAQEQLVQRRVTAEDHPSACLPDGVSRVQPQPSLQQPRGVPGDALLVLVERASQRRHAQPVVQIQPSAAVTRCSGCRSVPHTKPPGSPRRGRRRASARGPRYTKRRLRPRDHGTSVTLDAPVALPQPVDL